MPDLKKSLTLLLACVVAGPASSQDLRQMEADQNLQYNEQRGVSWTAEFRDPMYLVRYRGAGGVSEYRLVPESRRFENIPGAAGQVIGGPYRHRWEIEEDRNRLAEEGYPVNLTPIRITDRSGRIVTGFQLGSKPYIVGTEGPLSGDVNADFADFGRDYFPLPFELDHYLRHMRQLVNQQSGGTAAGVGEQAERSSNGTVGGDGRFQPYRNAAVLENGGGGRSFDPNRYRGKFFESSPTGTIREICVYARGAGTSVRVAVQPAPDGSGPVFQETIPITMDRQWNCRQVNRRWSARSLFIYKIGGEGAVGYEGGRPADSRYSRNGSTWSSDPYRRGYRVVISPSGTGGGVGSQERASNRRISANTRTQPSPRPAATSATAQTPALWGWHSLRPMNLTQRTCIDRASRALRAMRFQNVRTHDGWSISGQTSTLHAAIRCVSLGNQTMVDLSVAGAAGFRREASDMRDSLRDLMMSGRAEARPSRPDQRSRTRRFNYVETQNRRPALTYRIQRFTNSTVQSCRAACDGSSECRSFQYNSQSAGGTCQTFTVTRREAEARNAFQSRPGVFYEKQQ